MEIGVGSRSFLLGLLGMKNRARKSKRAEEAEKEREKQRQFVVKILITLLQSTRRLMSYELVRCSRAQESFLPYRVVNQNSIRLCAHTMGGKIVNFSSDPDSPVCATRFGLSTETRPDNILAQITVECKNCPQRRRSLQKKMQFLRPLYISCV